MQIKWRMVAVTIVSIFWTLMYSRLFCSEDIPPTMRYGHNHEETALSYLGWNWNFRDIIFISIHTTCLFLGPIVTDFLQSYNPDRLQIHSPIWATVRNLFVAPLTEEIVFRGCLIPPFLHSAQQINPLQVSILAPVFFGLAHVHHAFVKIKSGYLWQSVLMSTLVQYTYTSLFGTYVSYVFIKTQSLPGIVISHTICNTMGLPNLSFGSRHHFLYPYRGYISFCYALGIYLFFIGFDYL